MAGCRIKNVTLCIVKKVDKPLNGGGLVASIHDLYSEELSFNSAGPNPIKVFSASIDATPIFQPIREG